MKNGGEAEGCEVLSAKVQAFNSRKTDRKTVGSYCCAVTLCTVGTDALLYRAVADDGPALPLRVAAECGGDERRAKASEDAGSYENK